MKFVILDHYPPETKTHSAARTNDRHYDLLFEVSNCSELATFEVMELPELEGAVHVIRLADHRMEYLNYEGQISDNRGIVERYAFSDWSGELDAEALLKFDKGSSNFAGEAWTLKFDSDQLFRIA